MDGDPASLAYTSFDPDRPRDWPTAVSADDFRRLFPEETDAVEFKEGLSSLQDSMVAFSNTAGGLILVGVRDDGSIKGLSYSAAVEDKIRDAGLKLVRYPAGGDDFDLRQQFTGRSIVLEMASQKPVTNALVRERTGLDRQDVLALFDELVASGDLVRVGARRGTRYVLPEA